MAVSQDTPRVPRPSLYAAIRLAALVQQFRKLLKARVHSRVQLLKEQCQAFGSLALENLGGLMKLQACRSRLHQHLVLRCRHSIAKGKNVRPSTLLSHLDRHVTYGGRRLSHIAMHDHLFLQHNVQKLVNSSTIGEVSHILDLTTILLDRLYHARKAHDAKREPRIGFDGIKLEKFVANLEHLLKCLQQAALEALIHYSLELLEGDSHRRHDYWHHWKLPDDDWSEWPSGRRPLSTTWPWNIKPSLLVLWGVCWMFYINNPQYDNPGLAIQSGTAWRAQPLSPNSERSYHESTTPNSDYVPSVHHMAWRSPQPGHVHGAPNLSDAMQSSMIGIGAQHSEGPSGNPYIISNSTPSLATLAISTSSWPGYQGTDTAYCDINHHDWEPRQDRVTSTPQTTQQQTYLPASMSAFEATLYSQFSTSTDIRDLCPISPDFLTSTTNLVGPMQCSQNYLPSPQHSDASDRGFPICPNMSTPPLQQAISLASDISPNSCSANAGTGSPPRILHGQITCKHPDCALAPPSFSRKCEYTKHMDKHNRPHICSEPSCEKIQGFTYSGGLLRHQREVHKQHGGPKAPRMCPHPDCKRSTGTGFSRKENLTEHLRRVHRGVGIEGAEGMEAGGGGAGAVGGVSGSGSEVARRQSLEAAGAGSGGAPTQGRRKRARGDAADEEEVREESTRDLVKRLRREIEERDEQIQVLNIVVKQLVTQQPPHGQLQHQHQHQRGGR